ncbi:MAG: 1-phosphofructokinase [Bdellovibrionales bacterium]|nr:1-phosphofructokinase [Bdellovibrionales bacterium]
MIVLTSIGCRRWWLSFTGRTQHNDEYAQKPSIASIIIDLSTAHLTPSYTIMWCHASIYTLSQLAYTLDMIATVTPNPSIDQHVSIEKLIKDDTLRANRVRRDPAGKGINVSRVLKRLGKETAAYAITGGYAGHMFKRFLHREGVNLKTLDILEETRINIIITDESDYTQTRISVPGPHVTNHQQKKFVELMMHQDPFPTWWVLGGSLPEGIPDNFYAELIGCINARGGKCILDTDNEPLRLGVNARPYMIKPNQYELSRLVGRDIASEKDMIRETRSLVKKGVSIVAVTLGENGSLIVTADNAYRLTPPKVEAKSKVGAGDSFIAGAAMGFLQNLPIEEVFRHAVAAGTSAVLTEGTELVHKGTYEDLLAQIKVTNI